MIRKTTFILSTLGFIAMTGDVFALSVRQIKAENSSRVGEKKGVIEETDMRRFKLPPCVQTKIRLN